MSIYKCLISGIEKGLTLYRLALYLWVFFLVFSFLAAMPLISIVEKNLGHSLPGQPVAMPFELRVVEILLNHQIIFAPYVTLLMVLVFIMAFAAAFINAGLFGRTIAEENVSLGAFFTDGTRFFWRFFISAIMFIPFLIIILILYRLLVSPLNVWTEKALTEWPLIIASNLRMVFLLLLWSIYRMSLDLVRIILVREESRVVPAFRVAFRFLKRHFLRFWILFLLLGLFYLLLMLILFLMGKIFPVENLSGVIMLIILSQIQLLFRLLSRLIFVSAENCYYLANKNL